MSPEADLTALRTFLSEFDQFLKSDVIFWPLSGQSLVNQQLPALTIGGLLLVRRTLEARRDGLAPAQVTEAERLESQAEALFSRWPVNIEKKALKEISSRLNVWAAALDECGEHPASCAENYPSAVNHRVYLALLFPLVAKLPEADKGRSRLSTLDIRLRNLLVPGDFIWDAALAPAFPRENFWFLYGRPRLKS
jgi:hypothetical protein